MSFAENLKYLRKQRKMTQKELGKALDVALSTVGMWETVVVSPIWTLLFRSHVFLMFLSVI